MVHKVNNKSLFTLKKKHSKNGGFWNDIVSDRNHRQHPHGIGDDDEHAVKKFESPTLRKQESEEEMKVVLSEIEDQIDSLREQQKPKKKSSMTTAKSDPDYLDDWID